MRDGCSGNYIALSPVPPVLLPAHVCMQFDYSSAPEKTSLDCWLRTSAWVLYKAPFRKHSVPSELNWDSWEHPPPERHDDHTTGSKLYLLSAVFRINFLCISSLVQALGSSREAPTPSRVLGASLEPGTLLSEKLGVLSGLAM